MPILTLENVKRRLKVVIGDELNKFIPVMYVLPDPKSHKVQFKMNGHTYVVEFDIFLVS